MHGWFFSPWVLWTAAGAVLGAVTLMLWRKTRLNWLSGLCGALALLLLLTWYTDRNCQRRLRLVLTSADNRTAKELQLSSGDGVTAVTFGHLTVPHYPGDIPPIETDRRFHVDWSVSDRVTTEGFKPILASPVFEIAGFRIAHLVTPRGDHRYWGVNFPNWLGAACFGALSIAGFGCMYWRKRQRERRRGLCERCMFDLRGTPSLEDGSRRCGECGHVNLPLTSGAKSGEVVDSAASTNPPAEDRVE